MANLIYSIKVNELYYSGLRVLDVKIGKTTNIERTLTQYRRSGRGIDVLDLWEPNKDLTLSQCETGVHKIARKYAYSKESEKFIFLQDDYDKFSENVSSLLKISKYTPKQKAECIPEKAFQKKITNIKLENASETVKMIYNKIKNQMLNFDNDLIFNSQKCYISIKKRKNFAYIKFRKKKIRIVVMLPFDTGKKLVKKHKISVTSDGVQGFYGGECFNVDIEDQDHLDEVIDLLKKAYDYNS